MKLSCDFNNTLIFTRDISRAIFNEKQSLYSNLWLSPIRIHYLPPLCLHGYKIQSVEIDRASFRSTRSPGNFVNDETSDPSHRRSIITTHSSIDYQLAEDLKRKWRKIFLRICAGAIATARQTYISKRRRQYYYRRI